MKTNLILAGLFVLLLGSCRSYPYLSKPDKIDVHEHGSYILVINRTLPNLDGELIAIDSMEIIILDPVEGKCVSTPVSDIKRFSIRYAIPKHFGWTIPMGLLLSFINGAFSIFTLPLHLVVTTIVTVSGNNAYQYTNQELTYEQLKMFARFPQGIPPEIDLAGIK